MPDERAHLAGGGGLGVLRLQPRQVVGLQLSDGAGGRRVGGVSDGRRDADLARAQTLPDGLDIADRAA